MFCTYVQPLSRYITWWPVAWPENPLHNRAGTGHVQANKWLILAWERKQWQLQCIVITIMWFWNRLAGQLFNVHQDRRLAVQLYNWLVAHGQLYIGAMSRVSGYGRVCIQVESWLSSCAMGWPVMHWGWRLSSCTTGFLIKNLGVHAIMQQGRGIYISG